MAGRQHQVTEVFETYWMFAAERQNVYMARLRGERSPWTSDPVMATYRFTNAYRAADRVSQDLIRIAYQGPQDAENLLLRVLLFRFFNRPSTWAVLEGTFGELTTNSFSVHEYGRVLDRLHDQGGRIYSGAYIIPPPPYGQRRKHRNHLMLLDHMLRENVAFQLQDAASLREAYEIIASYPSLGPFLAYQLAIDLNYSELLNFDEDEFIVPGPGARSGIMKCFPTATATELPEIIRWMVDNQEEQFAAFDCSFETLFGRRLKLIDCQNLFCEVDKYARVAHPDVPGTGNRTRIKQQFRAEDQPPAPFFPPKWGIQLDKTLASPRA